MKREFLPRPLRACLWALLAVLVGIIYYIALGCPTFSIRQDFRRAEKVNLAGPSKIVDQVASAQYTEFDQMVVGETDQGICFFGRHGTLVSDGVHSGEYRYLFSYQEKTGDITFAAPPNIYGYNGIYALPVYVFTEYKNAARATISITVSGSRPSPQIGKAAQKPFKEVFRSEAERDKNGFFRFYLTAQFNFSPSDPFDRDNDEAYSLFCISNLSNGNAYYENQATMSIPITVTLFDADGNEIVTKELQLGAYEQEKD